MFYRLMQPLVMHANAMVEKFRAGLPGAREELAAEGRLSPESLALIKRVACSIDRDRPTRTFLD